MILCRFIQFENIPKPTLLVCVGKVPELAAKPQFRSLSETEALKEFKPLCGQLEYASEGQQVILIEGKELRTIRESQEVLLVTCPTQPISGTPSCFGFSIHGIGGI